LDRLCWYVGDKYLRDLKTPSTASFSPRVLNGILTLAEFLVTEARILETGSDQAKKEAKEQVPSDRIKDPAAYARELRWRAKQALGYDSEDEGSGPSWKSKGASVPLAGLKRRRVDEHEETHQVETPQFRNFRPKAWDAVVTSPAEEAERVSKAPRPQEGDEWARLFAAEDDTSLPSDGNDAHVNSRRLVVVKVRRTAKGLERQRIERTVEDWIWGEDQKMAD